MESMGQCTNWFDDWKLDLKIEKKKKKKKKSLKRQQHVHTHKNYGHSMPTVAWHPIYTLVWEHTYEVESSYFFYQQKFLTKNMSLRSECPTRIDG